MTKATGAEHNRQDQEVNIFHDVAKALTSSLDLDSILQTIMEKMAEYFRPDTWSLLMVDAWLKTHGLSNALSLPYLPLEELRFSQAAADVHVVTLGNLLAGIVHPCKLYGALEVSRPVLYFGRFTAGN